VKVKEYKVDFERINLSLVSERPGYVRLAHAWYPTIKAVRNGEAVQVLRESTGLMVLPLVAGVNVFEVRPVRTPQRVGLDWFTVGWVLIIVLLAWWLERRKNQLVGTPSVDQSAATRT
jgi:hypothetical protein